MAPSRVRQGDGFGIADEADDVALANGADYHL
jgi:hypothetical protein